MIDSRILLVLLLCFSMPSVADTALKKFEPNSLIELKKIRQEKPFIMVLWSIDCPPCIGELELLQKNRARLNRDNIILISTDNLKLEKEVRQTLKLFQLDTLDNWIFSNTLPERLRYHIDPSWYGELPRAYYYDFRHQRVSHSGVLSAQKLNQWINQMHSSSLLKIH